VIDIIALIALGIGIIAFCGFIGLVVALAWCVS
jgi:hypothetical protein